MLYILPTSEGPEVSIQEGQGCMRHANLQQDAARLFEAVHLKVLQVSTTVRDHKHDVHLVRAKFRDRVVLGPMLCVPRAPLAHERLRVTASADSDAKRAHKGGRGILCGDTCQGRMLAAFSSKLLGGMYEVGRNACAWQLQLHSQRAIPNIPGIMQYIHCTK